MSQTAGVAASPRFVISMAGLAVASIIGQLSIAPVAVAQSSDKKDASKNEEGQLLSDLIHYINIDNYKLAQSMGSELIGKGVKPKDFVGLVEKLDGGFERFDSAIAKALRVSELEPIGSALLKDYTKGKLELARDPDQIGEAIKMLKGTVRGQILATDRLKAAGEYAVPALLKAMLDTRGDSVLAASAREVLITMGPKAVGPLCVALNGLDDVGQERVADVLGTIGYPASLPYIAEVKASTKNAAVKAACERAMSKSSQAAAMNAGELFQALAERYYGESLDVTSFPGEEYQLLWEFKPQTGLFMTAIRSEVYHEAMAMRSAEKALTLKNESPETLALWVAANLKRELETPKGYENPSYASSRRDSMYYAVAAGSQVDQRVLARAIDTRNTGLARKAIAALDKTAGGKSLWSSGLDRQPLLEALRYPNRRVSYEAALALASAQPAEAFPGSDRVVPILAGAVRDASSRSAAVFASSVEVYQAIRAIAEKGGYKVLPFGKATGDIAQAIAEAPGVDLVIAANLNFEQTSGVVSDVRANPKLSASPVLVMTTQDVIPDLRKRFAGDTSIAIRSSAIGEEAASNTIRELVQATTGGPISPEEASIYSTRSLAALRDLAISGNQVLRVSDASRSLMSSLGDSRLNVRLDVAEVVSRINLAECQVAVAEAAFKASGPERVAILGKLAGSARRYGNQLAERHVNQLREIAQAKDTDEATAAAAVLGSLNLANSELLPLINAGK